MHPDADQAVRRYDAEIDRVCSQPPTAGTQWVELGLRCRVFGVLFADSLGAFHVADWLGQQLSRFRRD